MATLDSIFVPMTPKDLQGSINAGASSAEIVIGNNQIFAINASGDVNIAFGNSGMAAASNSNFRVPSGVTAEYDTGSQNDRIRLFNNGGSSINYWIQLLSRV